LSDREENNDLDFSDEEISDLERELENRPRVSQQGQPRHRAARRGKVRVTRDRAVGADVELEGPSGQDPDEDLDAATVIMKRPVFTTEPTPVGHSAVPPSSAAHDPSSDTSPDWGDDADGGATIEMQPETAPSTQSTMQGPGPGALPSGDQWANPGTGPFELEDDGMSTVEVPAPGAEPTGELQPEEPRDRMAILMAALGKSATAKHKRVQESDGPLQRSSSARRIMPEHNLAPAMRREQSTPGEPIPEPAPPGAAAPAAAPEPAEQPAPAVPTPAAPAPAAPAPAEDLAAATIAEGTLSSPFPVSEEPRDPDEGTVETLASEDVEPLSDDDEGATIPPPIQIRAREATTDPMPAVEPEEQGVELDLGATVPFPAPAEDEVAVPPVAEAPPPSTDPLAGPYFDPDQPSPFGRLVMEEASAEVEVDIDLDMDMEDEGGDNPFYPEEATPREAAKQEQPLPEEAAPGPPEVEEERTPPPIPEHEVAAMAQEAAAAAAEEDDVMTSAPPLGQEDLIRPPAEQAEDHGELPEESVDLLEESADLLEEVHEVHEELDLEDVEEASPEDLEAAAMAAATPTPTPQTEQQPPSPQAEQQPPTPSLAGAPAPQARAMTPRRSRPWYQDLFDQDWLRTIPSPPLEQTEKEVGFILDSLGVTAQSNILELGVGDGRHLLEVARRGFNITTLDSSLPLLLRAADISTRFSIKANFLNADYRDIGQDERFDAVYCVGTRLGFYDEDSNQLIIKSVNRALKPGGRYLLEVINRDYMLRDLPARIWRDGEDCLVLEEVEFDYFTSRIMSKRTVAFEDGRHTEQEISIRVYSLHEIGKLLHRNGFRVLEVSGHMAHRGSFFGDESASLVLLAEKRS